MGTVLWGLLIQFPDKRSVSFWLTRNLDHSSQIPGSNIPGTCLLAPLAISCDAAGTRGLGIRVKIRGSAHTHSKNAEIPQAWAATAGSLTKTFIRIDTLLAFAHA